MTQVFFAHKGELPDQAALSTFQEKDGTLFISGNTTKHSPFTGERLSPKSRQTLTATKADLANIIGVGKCRCGSSHRADIASVQAMLDANTTQFLCADCGKAVDFSPSMREYLSVKANLDSAADSDGDPDADSDADQDDVDDTVNSDDSDSDGGDNDDDVDAADNDEADSDSDADGADDDSDSNSGKDDGDGDADDSADVIDDTADDDNDEGDSDDHTPSDSSVDDQDQASDDDQDNDTDIIDDTDSSDDAGEDSEEDQDVKDDAKDSAALFTADDLSDEAKFDAIVRKLVDEASAEFGEDFAEADATDADVDKVDRVGETEPLGSTEEVKDGEEPDDEDKVKVDPNTEDRIVQIPVKGDHATGLFTGGNDNPEGTTVAQVMANPVNPGAEDDSEGGDADEAVLIPLDRKVNFKLADVACVLNSKRSAYFVFADNVPVGTLARERAHADNAALFEQDVFAKAFVNQMARGLDVSRFGYAPYTVKVNVAKHSKQKEAKLRADVAKVAGQDFDKKLNIIKDSMLTVATAANKRIWPDMANPVRDALVAKLTAIGVEDCAGIVDRAFAAKSSEHVEMLLTQALRLAELPAAVREERKRSVDTATYVLAQDGGSKFAEKLASFGNIKESAPAPTGMRLAGTDTANVAPPANKPAKFDWSRAF